MKFLKCLGDIVIILAYLCLSFSTTTTTTITTAIIQLSVQEESSPSLIGKIDDKYDSGEVIFGRDIYKSLVSIDLQSGQVSSLVPIDRELFENINAVVVDTKTDALLAEILITVEDQNDNYPVFSTPVQIIEIPESTNIGKYFTLQVPQDVDTGYNGLVANITFRQQTTAITKFDIIYKPNEGVCHLVLKKKLDREKDPFILLPILAQDGGHPPMTSQGMINVTVLDANDNKPKFRRSNIQLDLSEDTTVSSSIVSLDVTDEDEGFNSQIIYTLYGASSNYFAINEAGSVLLVQPLRYEKTQTLDLTVYAGDRGTPPNLAQAVLQIKVIDTNNNAPIIHVEKGQKLTIQENNSLGEILSFVTVGDYDSILANGALSLTLLNFQTVFEVRPFIKKKNLYSFQSQLIPAFLSQAEYIVTAKSSLDHAHKSRYNLVLQAADSKFTTNVSVVVSVKDMNDNRPVFSQRDFYTQLSVGSPAGSYVITTCATDADSDRNGHVSYKLIQSKYSSYFGVSTTQGVVTVLKPFANNDSLPEFVKLNISATDSGNPPQQSFATVKIDLLNRRKYCVPTIHTYPKHLTIRQNHSTHISLARYYVTCNQFQNMTLFTLQHQNSAEDFFRMDDHGFLFLKEFPATNQKINSRHKVTAWNILNPTLQTSVSTELTFLPAVSDASIATFNKSFYHLQVPENSKIGDLVTRISLPAATASYSILEKIVDGRVSIDNNGNLFLVKSLLGNLCLRFTVVAQLQDSLLKVSTRVFLAANKQSVSIRSITFKRDSYSFKIDEKSPIGSIVGRISLDDEHSTAEFYIESESDSLQIFKIDQNGFLSTRRMVDYELKSNYEITVAATVNCTLLRAKVLIKILDLNDHTPYFTSSNLVNISTPLTIHPVYQATARDLDSASHNNGKIAFKLLRNGNGYFCIDESSGHVFSTKKVHFERMFHLKLLVHDHGNPRRFSSMNLVLMLNATKRPNNSQQHFARLDAARIPEPTVPFYKIPDQNPATKFILQSNTDVFGMYENGWLYLREEEEYLRSPIYKLSVIAVNHRNEQSDITVLVTSDTSRPTKTFTNTTYIFTAPESLPVGSCIGSVSLVANQQQSFIFMAQANALVKLNNTMLITIAPLDCCSLRQDGKCRMIIPIYAIFNGTKASCVVIVEITDENNHPPRFLSNHVTYDVTEHDVIIPRHLLRISEGDVETNTKYQLMSKEYDSYFMLNSTTAEIKILKHLEKNVYILKILALDTLEMTFNDTMQLTIYNSNHDNALKLQNVRLTLAIDENFTIGSNVYKFNRPKNEPFLTYRMSADIHFAIHPDTGAIQLIQPLDFEQRSSHKLRISILSNTNTAAYCEITVIVINVNDNAPTLSNSIERLLVKDNTLVGSVLFSCAAFDSDMDDLTYSIDRESSTTIKDYFQLHSNNCSLRLTKDLKTFNYSQIDFKIFISDGVHMAALSIVVLVKRVSAPVVISPAASNIPDNINTGEVLYRVAVKSIYEDKGLQYLLTKGIYSTAFSLNKFTGTLSLTSPLSILNTRHITLSFIVKTRHNSTKFDLLLFRTALVSNLWFSGHQFTRAIQENNLPGYRLMELKASYPVSVPQSDIRYFITSGNVAGSFKIDRHSGQLIIYESLDRETIGQRIMLTIYAVDVGNPVYQTASTKVMVIIKDVNDNKPLFEKFEKEVWIEENKSSMKVVKVSATDADGDNVRYSIVPGNSNQLFFIQRDGWVVLGNVPLDHQQQNKYNLQISVTDDGQPALKSTVNLIVHVADVNDHRPTFRRHSYFFNVKESTSIGSDVGGVMATDGDSGRNGTLDYSIVSGDFGYFSIDVESGEIFTRKPINCSDVCAFFLEVEVHDGAGAAAKKSTTSVIINVQPEQKITLETSQYSVNVSENLLIGSRIIQIEANPSRWENEEVSIIKEQKIHFSLFGSEHFRVDETEGRVYSTTNLTGLHQDTVILYVALSTEEKTHQGEELCSMLDYATIDVHIIMDIKNNHAPRFLQTPLITVSELSLVGTMLGTLNCMDEDLGKNSHLSYTMLDPASCTAPYFNVQNNGTILLRQALDYELEKLYIFSVLVSDHGSPPLNVTQDVYISVQDENDNSPVITAHPYNISIPKNISAGAVIVQVNASDADDGVYGSLTFNLISNLTDVFFIDSQNGTVSIVNNSLLKHGDSYTVTILVQDNGSPPLKQTTEIVFNVFEINTPPYFTQDVYHVTVTENKGPLSSISTLQARDNDLAQINTKLFFQISSISPNTVGYFTIDRVTGALSLLKPIDREEVSEITLSVTVVDGGGLKSEAKVVIKVKDVNDFPPVILPNQSGRILENSPANTYVMQLQAYDLDSGLNGKLKYSLLNNKINFNIDSQNGIITARRSFDYEAQPANQFKVQVQVTDSAPPYLRNVTDVSIFIEDVNDNPPVFSKQAAIFLPTSTQYGSFVTSLEITDADSEKHSHARFSSTSPDVTVDMTTGVVTTVKAIITSPFTFQVNVWDPTYPDYKDAATIQVKTADPQLFPPLIPPLSSFVSIAENNDKFVKQTMTTIRSKRHSKNIRFRIASENTNYFTVSETSGELRITAALDYEEMTSHIVWVSVTDQYPTLRSYAKIIVFVTATNDNIPRFTLAEMTVYAEENVVKDSEIAKVTATDADYGDKIFYFLENSTAFRIDVSTGKIFADTDLDYEVRSEYNLTVWAANSVTLETTSAAKRDTMQLRVIIKNTNDNAPIFLTVPENITIAEDFLVGVPFYIFRASDADEMGTLVYSIGRSSSCLFINGASGQLSLSSSLDREKNSMFSFNISVTDGSFVTSHRTTLILQDVNDSPPQFENNNIVIDFLENTTHQNFTFLVTDLDEGDNAVSNIEFGIADESIKQNFILDNDGRLLARKLFNIKKRALSFHFTVKATNLAPPYFDTYANVTVRVIDINNHYPIFDRINYTRYIPVNIKPDDTVIQVKAVDGLDIGANAMINYSIMGGNGSSIFDVGVVSGKIKSKASLFPYESRTLLLRIRANDLGSPSLSSECLLTVFVEKINTYSPQVINGPFVITIRENYTVNTQVLQIDADDRESRKILFFTIVNGNEDSKWQIFNDGTLSLSSELDFEVKKMYELTIRISDATLNNQKSISTKVKISVIDVNDEAPKFEKQSYSIRVPENFNISNALLTVQAMDADSSQNNNRVSYSLRLPLDQNGSLFTITSQGGTIFSAEPFDYENKTSYHFNIQASDNGDPALTSVVPVTIHITGVNEFKPRFLFSFKSINISRIQPLGSKIATLKAYDQDRGEDGICIIKSTLPKKEGFYVNASTGNIIVTRKLNDMKTYAFKMIAMNKNNPEFYGVVSVNISVYDAIRSPVFAQHLYEVSVFENATVQSVVVKVSARHHDGDQNLVYGISGGDLKNQRFMLDATSGEVKISSKLDYETKKLHMLQVFAIFGDSPKGFTTVKVNILDVNDNSPKLARCTGNITENEPPGVTIIPKLKATDLDEFPNAGPFEFSLVDNFDKFEIDKQSGQIKNRKSLDREQNEIYNVKIRVKDNGDPQLYSVAQCTIFVLDVNDNFGSEREVDIYTTIESLKNQGFKLGDVSPLDVDTNDLYNCSTAGNGHELLLIDNNSCFLRLSPSTIPPNKNLAIKYWGQHKSEKRIPSSVSVVIRDINQAWFSSPVSVFIPGIRVAQFVSTKLLKFERVVNKEIVDRYDLIPRVFIVSVKDFQNGVIIVMLIDVPSKIYQNLYSYHLKEHLESLKSSLDLVYRPVIFDACAQEQCEKSLVCRSKLKFSRYEIINTPDLIFHSRMFSVQKQCRCQSGYVGLNCDQAPVLCSDNPCFGNAECSNHNNEMLCTCPKEFTGKYCQDDVNECGGTTPCQNGGSCVNTYGGFFCLCTGKYRGEICELEISPCFPNPCSNNGTCVVKASETNFKCECKFGDSGATCDTRSLNFDAAAYMEVPTTSSITNFTFSVEFATVEQEALLFFFYDSSGFFMLSQIKDWKIQVSIITKDDSTSIQSVAEVSDGQFHSLQINVNTKELIVIVGEHSKIVKNHHLSSYQPIIKSIFVGGVKSTIDISKVPHRTLSSTEFIGCMRKILVCGISIDSNKLPELSKGVSVGCKRNKDVCVGYVCGYGNECIDRWSHFECRCHGGYISRSCLRDYQTVRLASKGAMLSLSLTESQRRMQLLKQNIRERRSQLGMEQSILTISFRTRHNTGIIFNSTDTSGNTLIQLNEGKIKYSFQTTTQTERGGESSIDRDVNDGKWHILEAVAQQKTISLMLDSNHTTKHTFNFAVHQFVDINVKEYFFGKQFQGCLGKTKLNDNAFVLSSSTSKINIRPTSVEQGCIPTDVCLSKPCQNQSLTYCLDTWETYQCISPGLCSRANTCQNNGQCIPNGKTSFSCNCNRTPFGGPSCATPLACLPAPCRSNENCLSSGGPTFKCVVMESAASPQNFKIGYIVAIVLSVMFGIVCLAVCIAFLSSKRRWKEKEPKIDTLKTGFDNEAVYSSNKTTLEAGAKVQGKKRHKVSSSLPNLRERPFAVLKSKYKSAELFDQGVNPPSGDTRDSVVMETYGMGSGQVNHSYDSDGIPCPPLESGFESSYSENEDDECFSVPPEMYDFECASMQFSEMSFQHEVPSQRDRNHQSIPLNEMLRRNDLGHHGYSTESDSEAYFTCSESDYGGLKKSHHRPPPNKRNNPAYIISAHHNKKSSNMQLVKRPNNPSETSSIAWSNAESTLSSKKIATSHGRRRRRRSSNLRHKVLTSKQGNAEDAHRNNVQPWTDDEHRLEQLSEAEEYV